MELLCCQLLPAKCPRAVLCPQPRELLCQNKRGRGRFRHEKDHGTTHSKCSDPFNRPDSLLKSWKQAFEFGNFPHQHFQLPIAKEAETYVYKCTLCAVSQSSDIWSLWKIRNNFLSRGHFRYHDEREPGLFPHPIPCAANPTSLMQVSVFNNSVYTSRHHIIGELFHMHFSTPSLQFRTIV